MSDETGRSGGKCTRDIDNRSAQSNMMSSGFSALIRAATVQLTELIKEEEKNKRRNREDQIAAVGMVASREHYDSTEGTTDDSDVEHSAHYPRAPRCTFQKSPTKDTTPLVVPEKTPSPHSRGKRTFPEALMSLAIDPNNEDTIAFLPDHRYFCLRSSTFAQTLLPGHLDEYCSTFEEFLSLLHNWGFSRILCKQTDEARVVRSSRSRRNSEDFFRIDNRSFSTSRRRSSTVETVMQRLSETGNLTGSANAGILPAATIEVFRHPKFVKGDWAACRTIRFGESPTNARLSALPTFLDGAFSDRSRDPPPSSAESSPALISQQAPFQESDPLPKRRLSPNLTAGQNDSDVMSSVSHSTFPLHKSKRLSLDATGNGGDADEASRSDEVQSVTLALTAEKLNLQGGSNNVAKAAVAMESSLDSPVTSVHQVSVPGMPPGLIDQAVKSATHTIVKDAIETLLNDESHTKETYLKHFQELSRSSIPGVVPISKQLFEPSKEDEQEEQQHQDNNNNKPNVVLSALPENEDHDENHDSKDLMQFSTLASSLVEKSNVP